MAGRRPKLTPQIQADICARIAEGCTNADAAVQSGISESTFYRWKERGEKTTKGVYFQFCEAVTRAHASFREHHIGIIRRGAEEASVTRTVEVIEEGVEGQPGHKRKKVPDDYGRPARINVEGTIDNPSGGGPVAPIVNLIFDDGEGERKDGDGEATTGDGAGHDAAGDAPATG